jgi:hypothetical protein
MTIYGAVRGIPLTKFAAAAGVLLGVLIAVALVSLPALHGDSSLHQPVVSSAQTASSTNGVQAAPDGHWMDLARRPVAGRGSRPAAAPKGVHGATRLLAVGAL